MNILVIGAGAREQAICFRLKQSRHKSTLFSWPDSPAMRIVAQPIDLPAQADPIAIASRAHELGIGLAIIGPEAPLADGIADHFAAVNILVFGPKKFAAQLESSKHFSKEVMTAAGIPTAESSVHYNRQSCEAQALRLLKKDGKVVLKASGLAAGKGVFVCQNDDDLQEGLRRLYETNLKSAATEVLVEEFMSGREVSYFCSLGKSGIIPIGFAVDHKRLKDGDEGPNTGGMGCYTPVKWLPEDAESTVIQRVVQPLVQYFESKQIDYCGWLYVGLMWSDAGPRVVEFNVRLGDPEAEVLAIADDSDWLHDILCQVGIEKPSGETRERKPLSSALCVVMASSDYPYAESSLESCCLPNKLLGLQESGVAIWAAAIKDSSVSQCFETQRGRVLAVVGGGSSIESAREIVYAEVRRIKEMWPSAQFRHDIGVAANQRLIVSNS